MDRGAWQANVCGVAKSQTGLKQLSTHAFKKKKEREVGRAGGKGGKFPLLKAPEVLKISSQTKSF